METCEAIKNGLRDTSARSMPQMMRQKVEESQTKTPEASVPGAPTVQSQGDAHGNGKAEEDCQQREPLFSRFIKHNQYTDATMCTESTVRTRDFKPIKEWIVKGLKGIGPPRVSEDEIVQAINFRPSKDKDKYLPVNRLIDDLFSSWETPNQAPDLWRIYTIQLWMKMRGQPRKPSVDGSCKSPDSGTADGRKSHAVKEEPTELSYSASAEERH